MTKEQEEAIKTIDKMIKSYIEADECGLSNNDFKHEIRAMQTVLSISAESAEKDKIIAEKFAEIEKLKTDFKIVDQECSRLERKEAKQDKIIDKISEEVKENLAIEKRLKRENIEPDLYNQGRFYVSDNINNILKGK